MPSVSYSLSSFSLILRYRATISLLCSADSEYNSALLSTNVIVTHDGNLTWLSSAIFKSSCGMTQLFNNLVAHFFSLKMTKLNLFYK